MIMTKRARHLARRWLSTQSYSKRACTWCSFIFTRGEKQKAREEIESLREEYPNDVGVHFVRGVLARLDGDYERALRSFDRMVRLIPTNVWWPVTIERASSCTRAYEEALAELDEGAAIEPDHPLIANLSRAVCFIIVGR